jgi:hypothetical protein
MIPAAEQATVYRGGGRRWFTLRAAAHASAKAKIKERCDCDYCDHPEMPGAGREHLPCRYHNGTEFSEKVLRRLSRIYVAAYRATQ